MNLSDTLGIKNNLLNSLIELISKYKSVEKAVIFGSRARGDFKYNSDIDLCIYGSNLTLNDFNKIEASLNDLNTAFSFDLVHYDKLTKIELKNNIDKDGVEIYESKQITT